MLDPALVKSPDHYLFQNILAWGSGGAKQSREGRGNERPFTKAGCEHSERNFYFYTGLQAPIILKLYESEANTARIKGVQGDCIPPGGWCGMTREGQPAPAVSYFPKESKSAI